MNMLESIADRSSKTREQIASEVGITRMSLYNKMKDPHTFTIQEFTKFAISVRRSPRNLFTLILNN